MAGADVTASPHPGVLVRVDVFGGLRVWHGDREADAGPPRQRVVLAELICATGNVISVPGLIDILWTGDPPASAVNQVHRIVGQLRRTLEPGLPPHSTGTMILAAGVGYRIAVERVQCDLYRLRELVRAARAAAGAQDVTAASEAYAAALAIVQGAPFGGLDPRMAGRPEFVAVEQERVATAIAAADLAIIHGCSAPTLAAVVAIAASVPLHEPLHARLITLLAANGRRAEALVTFDVMRRRLTDELGVDPGPELAQAYQDLLVADVAVDGIAAPVKPTGSHPKPAQLPRPLPGFVHRPEAEAILTEGLSKPGGAAVITAFSGMAGIGKTALAVQWAHRVIDDFPDGQLYVNLRGFGPGGRAVEPGDAVNALLEALGQSLTGQSQATVEERAARYRSVMASRRMIIILDNARDSDQVRPLLPGSPQCLVLVTSRSRLTGLVAREGARFVPLGRLAPPEARRLLANRLGLPRVRAEPDAVAAIIAGCAGLPLALSIVAARIATSPELPMAELVAGLFGATAGLDGLSAGGGRDDVRTVFSWSAEALTADAARLFRLLGAHPGPDFSLVSIANLLGVDTVRARRIAAELVGAHMLTASSSDRYVLHDLLRVYAGELLDEAGERRGAEQRIVEHYLVATRAAYAVYGRAPIAELRTLDPDLVTEACESVGQALDWYVGERAALEAVVEIAIANRLLRHAVVLVLDRRPMNHTLDPLPASLSLSTRVLDATADMREGQTVEPVLVAELHRDVADRWEREGGPDSRMNADSHFASALSSFRAAGDLAGQSNTYRSLSYQAATRGDERQLEYAHEALRLARLAERDDLVVRTLINLADSLSELARHQEAIEVASEAIQTVGAMGLTYLKPLPLMIMARGWGALGRPAKSLALAQEALTLLAEAEEPLVEFASLAVAAEAALGCGDLDLATSYTERFRLMNATDESLVDGLGPAAVSRHREKVDAVVAAVAAGRSRPLH